MGHNNLSLPQRPGLGKSKAVRTSFRLRRGGRPGLLCAVPKLRAILKYWLPVIIWMAVIFSASADTSSLLHSSRLIAPLVRWLFPHMGEEGVFRLVFTVRKCAHLTEYAVLAWLLWRGMGQWLQDNPHPLFWRRARMALLGVALYAASDEFHQLFVATRDARVSDVLLDTTGGLIGLCLLWVWGRWRRRW